MLTKNKMKQILARRAGEEKLNFTAKNLDVQHAGGQDAKRYAKTTKINEVELILKCVAEECSGST